ncbi:MAG TPA: MEDS domain-containing protein [Vicinamibacterales bacterium]|nr:MEDS domain-containing protein [Vicinamibacterales bacterium]
MPAQHVAAFHHSDGFIVDRVASFVAEGLAAAEQVVVIATLPHWSAVTRRLHDQGVAYGRAAANGSLVLVEADQVADTLTAGGEFDLNGFRATLQPFLKAGARVRIYGEVVSLLVQRGQIEGALALERLGHELAAAFDIGIFCGYHTSGARRLTSRELAAIESLHHASVSEEQHFHAVRFYQDRDSLARIVAQFLGEGFAAGAPGIVIATPEHRMTLEAVLASYCFDVPGLESGGDLIMLDAAQLLSQFMVGDMPDASRFRDAVIPLIERASRGRPGCVVRAYGEMVDVLWKAGHTAAAVRLETMWNQLARTHTFALLCGYSIGHFYKDAACRQVPGLHTHVWSDGGPAAIAN